MDPQANTASTSYRASPSTMSIKGDSGGLSRLITDGEIFVGAEGRRDQITVRYPLSDPDDSLKAATILYHLISSSVGRPLWDYQSDAELLQGMLDAMDACELLWKNQILHRGVSAGNIILAVNPGPIGAVGFLSDVEFARMPADVRFSGDSEYASSATNCDDRLRSVAFAETAIRRSTFQTQRDAFLTGDFQFMALELLQAAQWKQSIKHTSEHDVESFVWVLGYCVLWKLCNNAYTINESGNEYIFMKAQFSKAFGQLSLEDIIENRSIGGPVRWCNKKESGPMEPFYQDHISTPLRELLQHFGEQALLRTFRDPARNPCFELLTYRTVRQRVQEAITLSQINPFGNRFQ